MLTGVEALTVPVLMLNVTVLNPLGTVTFAGTEAARLLLDKVTNAPPD